MMAMSNLQTGLAVGGILLVLAIALQGAWTSYKNRPRQATSEDKVPAGDSLDPELDGAAFEVARFPVQVVDKKSSLDALIDSIAAITPEGEVSGETALAAMPATRRAGGKPLAIEAFNAQLQRWEKPTAGQRYTQFQAGVQLANRSGWLNEIEFSEFVMKTQAFCDNINATPEFLEMTGEVARARELDQFASDHDAQLGFVLRATSAAWSPGYVQQNAAHLGFVAGAVPGHMVIASHTLGLPPVLSLSFDAQAALAEDLDLSAIRTLVMSFDVPQVERTAQAFVRMRDAMQVLAEQMDGEVTDDNGVKLTPEAMDAIAQQLERLYDTLDMRDLSAGSPLARRLFS